MAEKPQGQKKVEAWLRTLGDEVCPEKEGGGVSGGPQDPGIHDLGLGPAPPRNFNGTTRVSRPQSRVSQVNNPTVRPTTSVDVSPVSGANSIPLGKTRHEPQPQQSSTSSTMEAIASPRITCAYLNNYVGKNVTIVGKVLQLRGEEALIDADGNITAHLNRVSPILPSGSPSE
ncbi:hypothetical protein VTJ49DRAFT_5966 [Mycothermus thermophilus]|uniref:Uncharacterized protein n=1 Tax=Humicola insolens TaxID=85995 RepID=A0ABR3V258_HUMIN